MAETRGPETGAKLVLLAEDSEDEIFLFKRAFARTGITHKLHVVQDGAEAVAYLMGRGKYADRNQYPFPVLFLLDLKMRTMSGFEVLQWARSEPHTKELAIIVLTSSENSHDAKVAYRLGASSFLTKAHDFEEFVEQLNRLKGNWL